MSMITFCPSCERALYVLEGEPPFCPVCSCPLTELEEASEQSQK